MLYYVLFMVGGVAITALGVWLHRRTRSFIRRARRARGRYVTARTASAGVEEPRSTSYGVIEFQTESGQTIQFSGRVGTPFEARKVGREVEVLYDPAHPEEAIVSSFVELWFPPLIAYTVGIGWIVAVPVFWLLFGMPR